MLIALALAGCGDDFGISQIPSEILVTPGLVDVEDVLVGDEVTFPLQIDHIAGPPVAIRGVDVFDVSGDWFEFIGERPVVPVNGTAVVELRYAPEEEGYHRAVVTILSDAAENPEVRVNVRGHAVHPDLARWPAMVDFGPVAEGDSAVGRITVQNRGAVDLVLDALVVDSGAFEVESVLPIAVPGGAEVDLNLRFFAEDGDSIATTARFVFGGAGVELADVVLRANDCDGGLAHLYDADADGFTTCADDCDDDDDGVHPGASERPDGVDEDCDGVTDDGTPIYDDDGDGYTEQGGDCDDTTNQVRPGRAEVPGDGVDNDCDGQTDSGSDDVDLDGYGALGGDCDDRNAAVRPGLPELPDGLDNDCDSRIDEGTTLYDDDGDGYCDSVSSTCSGPGSRGDCNDDDRDRNSDGVPDGRAMRPGATEAPDGLDNDCDGDVDEGTVRGDDDHDGFTELGGDCDDTNPARSPGRAEVRGNGVDDDCDVNTPD